jgi:hypothetical protein
MIKEGAGLLYQIHRLIVRFKWQHRLLRSDLRYNARFLDYYGISLHEVQDRMKEDRQEPPGWWGTFLYHLTGGEEEGD